MTIIIDKNEGDGKLNRKLKRVLDEIQKAEKKITVWQEHLDELNVQKEFLENEEIIKSIRAMKLDSYTLLETLDGVQNGTVTFSNSGESGDHGEENAESTYTDTASKDGNKEHFESAYANIGENGVAEDSETEIPVDMADLEVNGIDEDYLPDDWAEEQEDDRIGK